MSHKEHGVLAVGPKDSSFSLACVLWPQVAGKSLPSLGLLQLSGLGLLCVLAVGPKHSWFTVTCMLCPQVAGKSLPSSGLLQLSGLKLLWISRKGHLLYKSAAEDEYQPVAHKAFAWLKQLQRGQTGTVPTSNASAAGTSQAVERHEGLSGSGSESPHDERREHMTVTIGGGSIASAEDVTLQVRWP